MIPVWLIAAIALLGAVCLALPLHIGMTGVCLLLLAAVLLASLAAPAALAAEGGDTVFVRTAEDLVQLAENCTLDS